MDYKFWNDVYKTAKPWILSVIIIGIIVLIYLSPENTKNFLNSNGFYKIITHFVNALLLLIALRLWDSKKFPFKWKRFFSLFLFSVGFINIIKQIFENIELK